VPAFRRSLHRSLSLFRLKEHKLAFITAHRALSLPQGLEHKPVRRMHGSLSSPWVIQQKKCKRHTIVDRPPLTRSSRWRPPAPGALSKPLQFNVHHFLNDLKDCPHLVKLSEASCSRHSGKAAPFLWASYAPLPEGLHGPPLTWCCRQRPPAPGTPAMRWPSCTLSVWRPCAGLQERTACAANGVGGQVANQVCCIHVQDSGGNTLHSKCGRRLGLMLARACTLSTVLSPMSKGATGTAPPGAVQAHTYAQRSLTHICAHLVRCPC